MHKDGTYTREDGPRRGERSFHTLLLYLNDGYEGGHTTLYNSEHMKTDVPPFPGMAFIHDHRILHESPHLVSGTKYVMRTDVMYEPA